MTESAEPSYRNGANRWGWPAKLFHWLGAVLVLGLTAQGWWMTHLLERAGRLPQYHLHGVIGYYLGVALLLRLVWRAMNRAPDHPPGLQAWENRAATLGHWALYLAMIAITLGGWLMHSAFPRRQAVELFGFLPVPFAFAEPNRDVFRVFEDVHLWMAYGMLALVVVHVLAALRHHVVKKNDVMRRMSPFG